MKEVNLKWEGMIILSFDHFQVVSVGNKIALLMAISQSGVHTKHDTQYGFTLKTLLHL